MPTPTPTDPNADYTRADSAVRTLRDAADHLERAQRALADLRHSPDVADVLHLMCTLDARVQSRVAALILRETARRDAAELAARAEQEEPTQCPA